MSNNDTDLYSYNLPGAEIHVTAVDLELSGELDQWVRDNVTAEEGPQCGKIRISGAVSASHIFTVPDGTLASTFVPSSENATA